LERYETATASALIELLGKRCQAVSVIDIGIPARSSAEPDGPEHRECYCRGPIDAVPKGGPGAYRCARDREKIDTPDQLVDHPVSDGLLFHCLRGPSERRVRGVADESRFDLSPAAFGLGGGLFYVTYVLFEVPSNIALEKVGARLWIARIMISPGASSPPPWPLSWARTRSMQCGCCSVPLRRDSSRA
jgi:hypothetical protein